jgi:hypothetical protein
MRYTLFFVLLFLLLSCNRLEEKDMAVLSAANESLEVSNKTIENNSLEIYSALNAYLSDPSKRTYTLKWQPIAEQVKTLTDSVITTINIIRQKLITETGGAFGRIQSTSHFNKTQPVSKVFFIEKNGEELNQQLANYKQKLFLINEEFANAFEKNILIYTKEYEIDSSTSKDFVTTYFKNINTLSAFLLLNKIENNIRKIENDFVRFCFDRTSVIHGCGFSQNISTILSQNSTVFKVGESIEITAGVGSFNTVSQLKITIDNKDVEINDGIGNYKSKVDKTVGKHTIPVTIEFTKPDGIKLKKSQQIEYTVVE